jgi:amino acid adenylation domain-containing protein
MIAARPGCPAGTVGELIAAQAAARPDAVAVRQWDTELTYAGLLVAARRLAGSLREHGVGPETRVGVCVGRHPALLVALVGVLLSGGAYVPLDPDLPALRLTATARAAGVSYVVADEAGRAVFAGTGLSIVDLPGAGPDPALACPAVPGNAAYVIYTSGSTGEPKGVVVSHANVSAFMTSIHERGRIERGSRALAITSIAFDVSVLELLVALMVGASVQLAAESDRADPDRLRRFMVEHEVSWADVAPALLPLLDPADLPLLRSVVTGAEAPGPEQVARWTADGRRLMNGYGPTETTVAVCGFVASGEWHTPVPIGRPMLNHRLYVVDSTLRLVPPETPGELLIGGPGVSRGYLGAPGLTAERFVADPFGDVPGERLYRTGDLVSWGADGQLRFHGRTDRQVKVRGQRVELAEIEAVLTGHPRVAHAVVAAVPGPQVSLAGFVTPADAPDDAELRAYLADRLPAVMVPARFRRLATLPLTTSDKVDVAALVAGVTAEALEVADIPGVPAELVAVWGAVLGVPAGSVEDDFFAAGGHSLAAMRLVAALRQELRRDVAVEDVFAARTLGGLAKRVGAAAELSDVDGVGLLTGNPPALSAAQRRLWFLDQLAPDASAYNIALAQRLHGPLDDDALRRALTEVVARHDVLRWRVPHDGGHPYAVLGPVTEVPLPVEDLTALSTSDRAGALRNRLRAEAATRFELAEGGLLRARLLRLGAEEHVLAITAHHAVFDGWSERILYQELGSAYAGAARPPLPAGFADYVAWREERSGRRGKEDLAWWTGHLSGAPAVLDLPRDRPRPAEQSYAGEFAAAAIGSATDAGIRALAAELGATPSTVVLAAYGELLRRVSGRDDVVIGSPVADRRHAAFAELIGFLVDIVPLRLRGAGERTFAELVTACRDELFDALAHPDAPLDRIVDALALPRDPSRGALVQVLFNVYNFAQAPLELPGIRGEPVPPGVPGSPFDLTTYLVERAGAMRFELVYNSDLFAPQRIKTLLAALTGLLEAAVAGPHRRVDELGVPHLAELRAGLVGEPPAARAEQVSLPEVPPAGVTERTVAAAWCAVLRRASVGVTQNFFDLGGASLDLVSLARLLPGNPRVVDLFHYPTVRAQAAFLDGATDHGSIDAAAQRGAARRGRDRRRAAARAGRRVEQ